MMIGYIWLVEETILTGERVSELAYFASLCVALRRLRGGLVLLRGFWGLFTCFACLLACFACVGGLVVWWFGALSLNRLVG